MSQSKKVELDICGQICPSTLLSALRKINELQADLKSGELVLEIKTDSRDATNTIPNASANMGLTASIEKCGGFYRIFIKGGGQESA